MKLGREGRVGGRERHQSNRLLSTSRWSRRVLICVQEVERDRCFHSPPLSAPRSGGELRKSLGPSLLSARVLYTQREGREMVLDLHRGVAGSRICPSAMQRTQLTQAFHAFSQFYSCSLNLSGQFIHSPRSIPPFCLLGGWLDSEIHLPAVEEPLTH